MLQNLKKELLKRKISFKENSSLKEISYFRSGGLVSLMIFPVTKEELKVSFEFVIQYDIPFKIIGETSNLLFLDDCDYSCLISTTKINQMHYDEDTNHIVCDAGVLLPDLSRFALLHSFTGYAGLEGIPGTVGGAIFMNAGAYGDNIQKVLESVDVLTPTGSLENIVISDLEYQYRDSIFKNGKNAGIILCGYFKCVVCAQQSIYNKMELYHAKRHKYQDFMFPNLGSVFSGSVYRALANKDKMYKIVSSLFYILNYKLKIFRRESPINRKWLNDYTVRKFGFDFEKQPFSDKSMNIIVNNGQHTDVYISYIRTIEEAIGDQVPLENEIVEEF